MQVGTVSVLVTKEQSRLEDSIDQILNHFENVLDPSRGFFLKPNIVFPVSPGSGEITRPVVVASAIRSLRKKFGNVDIVMGEGTAAGTVPEENFAVSGYRRLSEELKVPLLDLDREERVRVPWRFGELMVPDVVLKRTHINLPILKWSAAATISGAMKNIKGVISPSMKKTFHRLGLHEPLAHLAGIIRPQLTILDCVNFFKKDTVFLSADNTCELDLLASRLLNIEEPEYLLLAVNIGVGPRDFPVINEHLLNYRETPYRIKPYKNILNMRLWCNPRACSYCRQSLNKIKRGLSLGTFFSLSLYARLATYAILGVDFVFGSQPVFDKNTRRVICIGDCTKRLAEMNGYKHIPGCPPEKGDFLSYL
jgi:uncharacterized protein (DUF362 family)